MTYTLEIADRHVSKLARIVTAAFAVVQARLDLDLLTGSVARSDTLQIEGQIDQALSWMPDALDPGNLTGTPRIVKASKTLGDVLDDIAVDAGLVASIGLGLHVESEWAKKWARDRAGDLITSITETMRAEIRTLIATAAETGITPAEQAQLIRGMVGLTPRQQTALSNYARGLSEKSATGKTTTALGGRGRPLADQRYSTRPDKLTAKRMTEMTSRYGQRLLEHRAMTIARTETMRAANAGVWGAWDQAVLDGHINRTTIHREWITTPDDRLCDRCAPMTGRQAGFDESFLSDSRGLPGKILLPASGISVLFPPLHPKCRCTTSLHITTGSWNPLIS